MKKVVIISEALGGGVRKHILDLLLNLDKSKYKIYFIYNLDRADNLMKDSIKELGKIGIDLVEIKHMKREINLKSDLKAFKEVYKNLKNIKPDIVHCHSSKAGAIGRIVGKIIGIKNIYYTPHAYVMQNPNISNKKKVVYSIIEKYLSKIFTTKNINVSYGEREFAIKNRIDKSSKFLVVYNGIDETTEIYDTKNLKKELRIEEDDIVVGITARMDEQKDPFTFIKIADNIVKSNKKFKFIYVGDGIYKDEVSKYVINNNLQDNIKLLGFRSDIEKLLQVFDCYLITSLYEGMPYSLIEALKCKLPIIATNTIGNNEIVKDCFNGFLFEVKNHEEGSNKILELTRDKALMDRMSENSYKIFKEKFTLEKMIKDIELIYDDAKI